MAVKFKDYYDTLGVSRTATDDELRKSFRKLARKHHPDVNPGDKTAEDKFKEVNEAYEVLSDPAKRKKYDQLGSNWQAGADFTAPPQWDNGSTGADNGEFSDMFGSGSNGGGFSDFFENLFGSRGRTARGGRGGHAVRRRGEDIWAEIELTLEDAHRGATRTIQFEEAAPCGNCKGTGLRDGNICPACHGAGSIARLKTFDANIPPGVRDGSNIRLAGKGSPGLNGGSPGDLLLQVRLKTHPRFEVSSKDDVQVELPVAPWEAVLGAKLPVPTLDGNVEMTIPPGSQAGQRLRLRGKGLSRRDGGRGDQYVKVKIVTPLQPTEKEKSLFKQLAEESTFNPRDLPIDT
jgi:curved DNA-binding protein